MRSHGQLSTGPLTCACKKKQREDRRDHRCRIMKEKLEADENASKRRRMENDQVKTNLQRVKEEILRRKEIEQERNHQLNDAKRHERAQDTHQAFAPEETQWQQVEDHEDLERQTMMLLGQAHQTLQQQSKTTTEEPVSN